ncbi:transcriptional regulator [Dinoroseobacter shibae DFL 12 = DSM 16493]|jgi:transcriptional regulator with XRE-family HTH domain|uniref:Transcriptional regulator n=1 Tax=Dinoroseobacter shibae (strain DSM 16493 / NCIMB 14021 / DFL 12) TaxID=398580 RepID=A8LQW5_DINSH|nr:MULTISPECIES: helix-turn-helix domain-containing protein [Dinoroseobacter]ABV92508.1 transcriptional regulator [Dinoroseobacter shibae DFL 12 = DSM 16493]MDD9718230.1 helix-turn-helix domain-containing protein [Dinoroseobacter sp. PD6]URF47452.1 helix-turn-helix domain-containing protein [Dinoroseobacter shibae]URF51763.1 helix-turn-helix domain-containing protein [Dinoroseobacter shibae]
MPEDQDWYSEATATFGDRLAGAREAVGLTQAQLAKRLGVKAKTLRDWEEDLSEPRANRIQMLSGLLNVSLSWLMTGEGEGIDAPDLGSDMPGDVRAALTELRQVQAEMTRLSGRMARLEKRLRKSLENAP